MQRRFELVVPSFVNYIKHFLKLDLLIVKPLRDVILCFQKNPTPGTSLSILLSTLTSGSKKLVAESIPFQNVSDLITLLAARDIFDSIKKIKVYFFHQLQAAASVYIKYAQ